MQLPLRRTLRTLGAAAILAAIAGVAVAGVQLALRSQRSRSIADLPRAPVERRDLHVLAHFGGEVDSAEKTLIECELESVSLFSEGRTFTANGASQIIELVPEGSYVKRDEVLCRLDASSFEEMVRQQEIKLHQARSERQKAAFDLEVSEISLQEYRDGTLAQRRQLLAGELTLARSDQERQRDRLAWAERMVDHKYMAEGQLIRERLLMTKAQITIGRLELQIRNLERFEAPSAILRFESAVNRARSELTFQDLRLHRREEQMELFRKQVERCTIRAPHDGFVVYANEDDDDARIELGATVREKMDLFYLPNLSNMEVLTIVNETFLSRVTQGSPALVRVEALTHRILEGHVTAVAPLPKSRRSWRDSDEVKNFVARVQLHNPPPGLKPGMSAEVEIVASHEPRALVVPTTAVAVVGGQQVCYVTLSDRIERRPVETLPGTPDLVQVTSGLAEGDQVIADLKVLDGTVPVVDAAPPVRETATLSPDEERAEQMAEVAELLGL